MKKKIFEGNLKVFEFLRYVILLIVVGIDGVEKMGFRVLVFYVGIIK